MARMSPLKAFGISSGVALGLLVTATSVVKREIDQLSHRYNVALDITRGLPALFGLRFEGVHVKLHHVSNVDVQISEIEVHLFERPMRVVVVSPEIKMSGTTTDVSQQLQEWKQSRPQNTLSQSATKSSRNVEVRNAHLRWDGFETDSYVDMKNIGLQKKSDQYHISVEQVSMEASKRYAILGHRVQSKVAASDFQLLDLRTESAQVTIHREKAGQPKEPERVTANGDFIEHWLATAQRGMSVMQERIGESVEMRAESLIVDVMNDQGGEPLHIGPNRLLIQYHQNDVEVRYEPFQENGPLPVVNVHAQIPIEKDALWNLDFKGKVGLQSLGVTEGSMGLRNTKETVLSGEAKVQLKRGGKEIELLGNGAIQNLSFESKLITNQIISPFDIGWKLDSKWSKETSTFQFKRSEFQLGKARLEATGEYRFGNTPLVNAQVKLPSVGCDNLVHALPKGVAPHLDGMVFSGTIDFEGKIALDPADVSRKFDFGWLLNNHCRVESVPWDVDVTRFEQAFTYWGYDPNGQRVELQTGPGTGTWVAYRVLPKYIGAAFVTAEDGRFFRHHGFDEEAIRNSLRENAKKKKFIRGASTLTMQLAKNLYLERGKHLARKFEEAFLTMYLEQALHKEEILGLYLNVVEFGPMIYGIESAARHYFHVSARDLSVSQAFYLASILPSPKNSHMSAEGTLTDGWLRYVRLLITKARDAKRITEEEYEAGMEENVVMGVGVRRGSGEELSEETTF